MQRSELTALIKELQQEKQELEQVLEFLKSRYGQDARATQPAKTRVAKATGRPKRIQVAPVVELKRATRKKRQVSEEARRKMSEAAKKRHAARRRESGK